MSTKGSKRRTRRLNTTEDEQEKKEIEVIEDNQSNISTDTEKIDKVTSLKETKDKEIKENPKKDKEIKENPKKDKEIKESPKKEEKIENGDSPPQKTIENGAEEPPQEQKTNGEHTTNLEPQISPEESCDMEPLILDSEEQELQFISESETSEVDKSPILNRCKTRRSQNRNLPTPKTPKTMEDVCQLELKIPKIDEEEKSELNDTISVESSFSEQTQESDITNASVLVNFGDTTRNIDITTTTIDDSTLNASSFIDSTKDKTYGETLRCLTGRKTLRSTLGYKPRFYSSTIELSKDLTDSSGKYSTLTTGIKRKIETDDDKDLSPTFLSYLSPFKKAQRTELPSSTPKLTGFKFGSHEVVEKVEEKNKKWCSIM